jgi:predicted nucleic-acid-binding protein
VDSEDNWYVLKNGMRVLRDSVDEVIELMKNNVESIDTDGMIMTMKDGTRVGL